MPAVALYIFKTFLISGLLSAYYAIALRNKKFHLYNRFYLLSALVISLILPLMHLRLFAIEVPTTSATAFVLSAIDRGSSSAGNVTAPASGWMLPAVCIVISVVLLLVFFYKVSWIYQIKRKHRKIKMEGFTLIETELRQAPFSFLDNLFWNQAISFSHPDGKKIFNHELTHIKEKHTYDKLLAQIISCIFWMNPFFWIIQRELNMIHEFMADERSVMEEDPQSLARMLLYSYDRGRYLDPSHAFFYSPIKRRLLMITTSRHTPFSYARRLLALPVAVLVFSLFSLNVVHGQSTDANIAIIKTLEKSLHPNDHLLITITEKDAKTGNLLPVTYDIKNEADMKAMLRQLNEKKIARIEMATPENSQKNPGEKKLFTPGSEKKNPNEHKNGGN